MSGGWVKRSGSITGGTRTATWMERALPDGHTVCRDIVYDDDGDSYRTCGEKPQLRYAGERAPSKGELMRTAGDDLAPRARSLSVVGDGSSAPSARSSSARGPVRIGITTYAWEQIRKPQRTYRGLTELGFGGVELGGALYGRWEGNELLIDDACGRVVPDSSSEVRCRLDTEYIDRMTSRHAEVTGLVLCGTWHTHPTIGDAGYGEASPADIRHWRAWARESSSDVFIGAILTPAVNDSQWGWTSPKVTAVVNRRHDTGITDPAQLEYARVAVEDAPGRCADLPGDRE